VTSCCEQGDESSCSIECGDVLHLLSFDCSLHKKDCAEWNWRVGNFSNSPS
jgi:hypothetical protein